MKKFVIIIICLLVILSTTACFHKHEWVEATCTEPRTCNTCGEVEGDALGHTWTDATCATPETCSSCGKKRGNALEHEWIEATCTAPQKCSNCSATQGEVQHEWVEASCTTPKTCVECSLVEGQPLGHQWEDATFEAPKTCTLCELTEGEPLPISYFDIQFSEFMKNFNKEYKGVLSIEQTKSSINIYVDGAKNYGNIIVFGIAQHVPDDRYGKSYVNTAPEDFNMLVIRNVYNGSTFDYDTAAAIMTIGCLAAQILDPSLDSSTIASDFSFTSITDDYASGAAYMDGYEFTLEYFDITGGLLETTKSMVYEFIIKLTANQ